MRLDHIITGTGRCGTVYLSKLFTSVGLDCGHEVVFDHQGWEAALERLDGRMPLGYSEVSQRDEDILPDLGRLVAESSYLAAPFLGRTPIEECRILHVIRHPVRVINSFCNFLGYFEGSEPSGFYNIRWERFMHAHVPSLGGTMSHHERGALFCVEWNEMIERNAPPSLYHRVRIEDGNGPVLSYLGVNRTDGLYRNTKSNSFEKVGRRFQLCQLPQGEIRDRLVALGERYGYNMELENMVI